MREAARLGAHRAPRRGSRSASLAPPGAFITQRGRLARVSLPKNRRWLFWEVSPARVDLRRDAHYVMARVLEHGMLDDVRWLVRTYGPRQPAL